MADNITIKGINSSGKMGRVGLDGSRLKVSSITANTLVTNSYDYVSIARPDSDTEIYTYKLGGSSGTTIATVTLVSSSGDLINITKV